MEYIINVKYLISAYHWIEGFFIIDDKVISLQHCLTSQLDRGPSYTSKYLHAWR